MCERTEDSAARTSEKREKLSRVRNGERERERDLGKRRKEFEKV